MQHHPKALTYIATHFQTQVSNEDKAHTLFVLQGVAKLPGMLALIKSILPKLIESSLLSSVAADSWMMRVVRQGTVFEEDDASTKPLDESEALVDIVLQEWSLSIIDDKEQWEKRCRETRETFAEFFLTAPRAKLVQDLILDVLTFCVNSISLPLLTTKEADVDAFVRMQLTCLCELIVCAFVYRVKIPKPQQAALRRPLEKMLGSCSVQHLSILCEHLLIALVLLQSSSIDSSLYHSRLEPMWQARASQNTLSVSSALAWMYVYAYVGRGGEEKKTEEGPSLHTTTTKRTKKINYSTEENYEPEHDAYNWDKIGRVFIGDSQIHASKNTGRGVFADTTFVPGDVITQYCGEYFRTLPPKLARDPNTPYLREFVFDPKLHPKEWSKQFRTVFINGESDISKCTSRQVGQIIQDPRDALFVNTENKYIPALWVPPEYRDDACVHGKGVPKNKEHRMHFFHVATRVIHPGEEIYTDYSFRDERGNRDESVYDRFGMIAKDPATVGLAPPKRLNVLRT